MKPLTNEPSTRTDTSPHLFPVLILGGGGHCRVVLDVLRLMDRQVLGILTLDRASWGKVIAQAKVLGDDAVLEQYHPSEVELVNGIGSVGVPTHRAGMYEKFKAAGFRFATIIHPSSVLAKDVDIGEGAQIMAGCIVQPGCSIGINTIINTGACLDHECRIGDHVHIAPGAVLSGNVTVGPRTHVGTSTTIIQGISIGESVLIAAGSVVIGDIPSDAKAMGIPARVIPS
jgi:sugar O-acyltransferase (sialic acid O-acetyltransferase NeuD family)